MPANRPRVPRPLERSLFVEAGHRCAIPTCRAPSPLQIEHIVDWATVKAHEFDNMIVLCANCHGRKGNGPGQIDRLSLKIYKANLGLITSRYIDLERRVLETMGYQLTPLTGLAELYQQHGVEHDPRPSFQMPLYLRMSISNLIHDGLIEPVPPGTGFVIHIPGFTTPALQIVPEPAKPGSYMPEGMAMMEFWQLTAAGVEFVTKFYGGQALPDALVDDEDEDDQAGA